MVNLSLVAIGFLVSFVRLLMFSYLVSESVGEPLSDRVTLIRSGDLDVTHLRPTVRKSGQLHTCLAQTWLWLAPPGETEEGRGLGAWLDSLRRFATMAYTFGRVETE